MPKRTNDFQKLIHFIESSLAPTGVKVTESAFVAPLDGGEPAEIDILVEAAVGQHQLRVALECRDHGRPSTVEWINALIGRYAVLPIDRVIAVTRAGFTAGARHRAKGSKIQLFTLDEAIEANWPTVFQGWRLALVKLQPRLGGIRVTYKGEGPSLEGDRLLQASIIDSAGLYRSTVMDDVKMLYTTEAAKLLRQWWPTQARELLASDPDLERSVELYFSARDRFVVGDDGRKCEIDRIFLDVICTFTVEHPEPRFYEYNGARVTEFTDQRPEGSIANLSILLDDITGLPRTVNVRTID